jgi:DNA-binding LacI/PurR family transcriptional regulator
MRRVTIQRIAQRVGYHFTTVAEALKNGVRVKPATRAKIQAVAREMGYVPDPMLSALSAYRRAIKPPVYRETLAWITSHPSRDEWRKSFGVLQSGAVERATELGYRLEEFWIKQPGLSAREATRRLYNRGIRGLLIAPLFSPRGHLSLEWNRFSSVALGYTLVRPRMNRVSTTHYRAVIMAVRHLRAAGRRRIGWVGSSVVDERTDRLWLSGFLSERRNSSVAGAIHSYRSFDARRFFEWFETFHPDAILTSCSKEEIKAWMNGLRKRGHHVPDDVSVAVVNLQEEGDISGIVEPNFLIGRTAVDLLTRMLQNGERGVPEYPLYQLIDGKWNEGKTLVRKHHGAKLSSGHSRATRKSASAIPS